VKRPANDIVMLYCRPVRPRYQQAGLGGSAILTYSYDADNRLTNRCSAAKGNTGYSYDPVKGSVN
jgi:hypothetical protein